MTTISITIQSELEVLGERQTNRLPFSYRILRSRPTTSEREGHAHILISLLVGSQESNTSTVDNTSIYVSDPNLVLLSIQNLIRAHIRSLLLDESLKRHFQPYIHCQSLALILALGGLSECGKSTLGAFIDACPRFGRIGRRLKIEYLMDNASNRLGRDVYDLPERMQAGQVMVQEIEAYSKAHFWLKVISLESVHRFGSIEEAKRIIGGLMRIVYVDVGEEVRIRREVERKGRDVDTEAKIREVVRKKDKAKRARGVERVRDIADLVLREL